MNLPLFLDKLPDDVAQIQVLTDLPTKKSLERVVCSTRLSKWAVDEPNGSSGYPYFFALHREPA